MRYTIIISFILPHILLGSTVSFEKDISMTLKEKQTLDKFRERVTPLLKHDYMKTDIYLVRWLRARNFNLDAAEDTLKENLRWRTKQNMDNILKEPFNDITQDFPATINAYDKEGRPMIDIGVWDIRKAVIQGRGQRVLRYMDHLMENATTQVFEQQAKGMNVTQWKVLSNCDTFNLVTQGCPACIPLWAQFVNSLENHFPGWLDELIAVDSPSAVHVMVQILRPLLSQNTRQALKIFGHNRAQWMPYLDERISKKERTVSYGGIKPSPQL